MTTKTEPESESLTEPDSMQVVKPLTKQEKEKLAKLEGVVAEHRKSFFEVVNAVFTIKEDNLWREEHGSWEDYVEKKLKISRQHSYRLLDAGSIIDRVKKTVTLGDKPVLRLPGNERAYREMKPLIEKEVDDDKLVKLIEKANELAVDGFDIEPGDVRKAALKLRMISKPKRAVFELKEEWGKIRDGLAGVVKVLEKHEGLEEQATLLKELLEKVKEAVRRCPVPPKPKKKTEPKTTSKAKGSKPAPPKPRKAKK